jgi:hypothetical protein
MEAYVSNFPNPPMSVGGVRQDSVELHFVVEDNPQGRLLLVSADRLEPLEGHASSKAWKPGPW